MLHPIGRGINNPVKISQPTNGLVQCCIAIRWWLDANSRCLQTICPQILQPCCQLGSLSPRTSYQNPLAKEGFQLWIIKPSQLLPQLYHIAYQKDAWWLDLLIFSHFSCLSYRRGPHLLLCLGAPTDNCHRSITAAAVFHQLCRNLWQIGYTHEEYHCIRGGGKLLPVNIRIILGWILVACYHGKRSSNAPMGNRNPGISRHRYSGGYSRHNLKRQIVFL